MAYFVILDMRREPISYFMRTGSSPFSRLVRIRTKITMSMTIYIPTTLWNKYVGMLFPKNPPMSAPFPSAANSSAAFARTPIIIVTRETIEITTPEIIGARKETCPRILERLSAKRSFIRSFPMWISLR